MNEYEIAWESAAINSLRKIAERIEKSADKSTADKVRMEIVTKVETLRKFPTSYPLEPALAHRPEKFRFIKQWEYKVIFMVDEFENLVIINLVYHSKQNPNKLKASFK
jgi:plasmid stabilization system protein ParE